MKILIVFLLTCSCVESVQYPKTDQQKILVYRPDSINYKHSEHVIYHYDKSVEFRYMGPSLIVSEKDLPAIKVIFEKADKINEYCRSTISISFPEPKLIGTFGDYKFYYNFKDLNEEVPNGELYCTIETQKYKVFSLHDFYDVYSYRDKELPRKFSEMIGKDRDKYYSDLQSYNEYKKYKLEELKKMDEEINKK